MGSVPKKMAARKRFWQRAVKRWEVSSLESMAEFCRQENLPLKGFYSWRVKLTQPKQSVEEQRAQDSISFLPVTVQPMVSATMQAPTPSPALRIEIDGRIGIPVHPGFDPVLLRSVVEALA